MNMKKMLLTLMLLTLTLMMLTLMTLMMLMMQMMLMMLMMRMMLMMLIMLMLMLTQRSSKMRRRNDERENEREIWSIEKKIEKCEFYWFIDQKMHVNLSRNSINRFFNLNDVNDDVVIDSMKIDWVEIMRKLITSTSHSNFVRFISTHDAHLTEWLSIQQNELIVSQ